MKPMMNHHVIPDEDIALGLNYAVAIGVLEDWEVTHVYRTERTVRYWRVMLNTGDVAVWTAGLAATFGLGVRLASGWVPEGDEDE